MSVALKLHPVNLGKPYLNCCVNTLLTETPVWSDCQHFQSYESNRRISNKQLKLECESMLISGTAVEGASCLFVLTGTLICGGAREMGS